MNPIYFDEKKDETDTQVKFGDSHTNEFDIWIRKKDCSYDRYNHGWRVKIILQLK